MRSSPISARGVFERWARSRQQLQEPGLPGRPGSRLSDASVASVRTAWSSWTGFLEKLAVPWHEARPEHVQRFLARLRGSRVTQRVRGMKNLRTLREPASAVTRARYARWLQEVYGFAVGLGFVAVNPVPAKLLTRERGASLVFNRREWLRLVRAAAARVPEDWTVCRDSALLLLMLQLGLTVSELRQLELGDVTHPLLRRTSAGVRWRGPDLVGHAGPVRLSLTGTRRGQAARQVEVGDAARAALERWLAERVQLAGTQARADAPLFISRKGFGPLTAKTVFLVADEHVQAVLGPQTHTGPTALRNSCIARWLESGMDAHDVALRAGLKDANSLARMRHAA